MSKRFGRNQRRRMREEIANLSTGMKETYALFSKTSERVRCLEDSLAMDRGLLQHQRRKLDEARDFIATIATIVGEYSMLCNELTHFELNRPEFEDSFRLSPQLSLPSFEDFKLHLESDMASTVQIETMRLLKVKAVRDSVSGAMHCHASLAGGQASYAISYSALKSLSTSMLYKLVLPQLAEALIKDIKKGHRQ